MKCSCLVSSDHPSKGGEHMNHCPLYESEPTGATVLVFRNDVGQPVAVPEAVVMEAERPYRAYKAMMSGVSWADIARQEGYSDAAAARYDVQRYVEEGKSLVAMNSRRDQLQLEVARLDALQAAHWDDAIHKKHLPAAKFVLDTIVVRSKLLSLAEMTEAEGGSEQPTTVIVPSEGYQEHLESLAEGS